MMFFFKRCNIFLNFLWAHYSYLQSFLLFPRLSLSSRAQLFYSLDRGTHGQGLPTSRFHSRSGTGCELVSVTGKPRWGGLSWGLQPPHTESWLDVSPHTSLQSFWKSRFGTEVRYSVLACSVWDTYKNHKLGCQMGRWSDGSAFWEQVWTCITTVGRQSTDGS